MVMSATRLALIPTRVAIWTEPGVIHVRGDVDSSSELDFLAALKQCDEDPCIFALDLTAVEFFGTAGVRCFIQRQWPTRPHVPIIASRAVRRVLTMCDLEFLMELHGWRDQQDLREPPILRPVG